MARSRFENLDPDRQEELLAAAAEEFAAHGYGRASLNRIIEEAGISKGSLYYYFDDKADLFASVLERGVMRIVGHIGGFALDELDRTNYWEKVREWGMRSIDLMSLDAWYVRLAMAFHRFRAEPEAMESVEPTMEWGRKLTRELLKRGRELTVVRRDLPLEFLVAVTMAADEAGDRWMVEHLDELEGDRLQRFIEARIDLMRDMLDAENEGWE
jgi:AcrR family transcriptional regulator